MAADYSGLINQVNTMILQQDRIMVAAVNSVLVAQRKRIFGEGKDSKETQIGTYSTNSISISKSKQSRDTGKTYFKGGYKEYKSLTGKGSSFVNLRNTDQMMMDLGVVVGQKTYGIGFRNQFNADKAEWMDKKYGKDIFNTTESENSLMQKVVDFEIGKILN